MQHTVEATSIAPISTTTRHTQEPEIAPFRLLDLPRELRDHIYSFMVASSRSYHKLTRQPSDWFNPAILGVNHQIHKEASEAISKTGSQDPPQLPYHRDLLLGTVEIDII
jgi:hypothetical protein